MRAFVLALSLLAVPALAAGKTKVLIDAPKPVAALLAKTVKAKHTIGSASLSEEPTSGDVSKVCLAQGAVAIITARATGDLYNFMVLNCADGSPLSTFRIKWGKKPPKALAKGDVTVLLQAINEGKPAKPGAKAPPPVEEKPPPAEEKPPPVAETPKRVEPTQPPPPPQAPAEEVVREQPREEPTGARPQALRLGVGVKAFTRIFGYTDDIFNKLSTYKLPLGPALALDADVYPVAFLMRGAAANVGALVYFDYAVGIQSKAADGTRFGTSAMTLKIAATYRLALGAVQVNPFIGYSLETYGISATAGGTTPKPNIPNVGYSGLRGGLQARVHLIGPVSVQLSFAGQYLMSEGEIGSAAFFPHAKAGGLDAQLAVPIAIIDRVEVKVQGDYTRFWYSMNPVPGDMYIAGGALDVYASGSVIVAFTL
jgi:hypothetical protein